MTCKVDHALIKLINSKMKFGDTLREKRVDKWSSKYIDYKALKKAIKQIVQNDELGTLRCN